MQLPLENDPGRNRQSPAPDREPEGAATLTSAMVRRGHNPWWGKDQMPAAATMAEDDGPHASETPAEAPEPAPRKPFHRIEIDDSDDDGDDGNGGGDNAGTKRFRFDWRDGGLWRDVAVFVGVFFAACSAMLYLSLRAL